MRLKPYVILIHIFAWATFLTIPFLFHHELHHPDFRSSHMAFRPPQPSSILAQVLIINSCLIVFFYLNSSWLMGAFFLKKKIVTYILIVAGFLGFFILLTTFLPELLRGQSVHLRRAVNLIPILMFLLILVVSSFIKITQQWIISESRSKNIETEKLNTELSFLKSQINPHFLFNTLNNIYTLALTKSDFTAEAVMKLSSLMRYVVDDAKNDYVPLVKEIEYLKHFVELQRIRLADNIVIDLRIEGNYDNLLIAPLILMPFVENAFKYGLSSHESSKVSISLLSSDTSIHFKTVNTIFRHAGEKDFTGIGIKNTVRRLDLLYPAKYTLDISNTGNEFIVDLNLIIK